jgi:hypothetical protein
MPPMPQLYAATPPPPPPMQQLPLRTDARQTTSPQSTHWAPATSADAADHHGDRCRGRRHDHDCRAHAPLSAAGRFDRRCCGQWRNAHRKIIFDRLLHLLRRSCPCRRGGNLSIDHHGSHGSADRRSAYGWEDRLTPALGGATDGGGNQGARHRHDRQVEPPMIERTFDAAFFNRICNLARGSSRPWRRRASSTSPRPVTDERNFALRTEHGGFILMPHGAGFYSVHTQFAAEGRGRHAIAAMQSGLDFMFTRTDCMRIFSHCPDNNPATLALALKGGAKAWFRKEHDPLGPGTVVSWDIMDWATNTPDLEADGKQFHDLLEAAKTEAGSSQPVHDDEPCPRPDGRGGQPHVSSRPSSKGGDPLQSVGGARRDTRRSPSSPTIRPGRCRRWRGGIEDGVMRVLAVKH